MAKLLPFDFADIVNEGDRRHVEQMAPSKVSVMPRELDRVMTPHELGDLIAYWRGLKGPEFRLARKESGFP